MIRNLPANKGPGLDGFKTELKKKKIKEKLTPVLLKCFQNISEEGIPNSFYEATFTLIPISDKNAKRKKKKKKTTGQYH